VKRKTISIRFYEELNDFLPEERRKKLFEHEIVGNPSVKDVIESLGVPHTEVDLILVDEKSVDFTHQIHGEERVSVYPTFELLDIKPVTKLRPKPLREPKFLLDVHLGKLARYLRMLGFDTLYETDLDDPEIIDLLKQETRILLTRDIGLLKNKIVTHGRWLRETDPKLQMREILNHFDLYSCISPLTRCIECNGDIVSVSKKKILDKLPPKTKEFFNEFFQCQKCLNVYWRGSHYEDMLKMVDEFKRQS